MERKKRIFISFLIFIIIICSIFVVAIEYQFFGNDEIKKNVSTFVRIFVDEKSGPIPFEVNFSSLVLYHKGNVDYLWDFDDNETSHEVNPFHIFNQTGVYECSLTVTDSVGNKGSDIVEITVRDNDAPIVSITMSDLKPNRPLIPIIRRKRISINMYGQNLRRLIDSKNFPKSLLNIKGFVSCYATASSPEGNKIVSYDWELYPPPYSKINLVQEKPIYRFSGKNITIPLLYTFPEAPYDLTVKVTDSKGLVGTSTIKFEVQLHKFESSIRILKGSFKTIRQDIWHNILKGFLGEPFGDLVFEEFYPKIEGFANFKSLALVMLIFKWGISASNNVIANVSTEFLKKHKIVSNIIDKVINSIISQLNKRKQKSPDLAPIIDKFIDLLEKILEQIGLQNKRPVLSNESPSDEAKDLSTNYPEVAITVKDPEGDPFNITIHGKYVHNLTLEDQYNNTFIAKLKTPLPNLTTIKWHVNISYSQNKWITETYSFSTW